jgi:hypothetical protein
MKKPANEPRVYFTNLTNQFSIDQAEELGLGSNYFLLVIICSNFPSPLLSWNSATSNRKLTARAARLTSYVVIFAD